MALKFAFKAAENSSLLRDYRDGQVILPQGFNRQAMGLIVEGEVEVYHKTFDGEETVLKVLGVNDTFGVHSLFEDIVRPSGIRARGKARVALMDTREYLRFAHEAPHLTLQLLKSISLRLKGLAEVVKQKSNNADSLCQTELQKVDL